MADRSLHSSIRDVLHRLKVQEVEPLADAELLERYATTRGTRPPSPRWSAATGRPS
jgi:hypothetical protein